MDEQKLTNKDLVQVSLIPQGAYFTYKLRVTRGIRGNDKGKVDEVLIHGVPTKRLQDFCVKNNIIITNMAVYDTDLDHPILFRDGETLNYVEEEKLNAKEQR